MCPIFLSLLTTNLERCLKGTVMTFESEGFDLGKRGKSCSVSLWMQSESLHCYPLRIHSLCSETVLSIWPGRLNFSVFPRAEAVNNEFTAAGETHLRNSINQNTCWGNGFSKSYQGRAQEKLYLACGCSVNWGQTVQGRTAEFLLV